MERIVKSLLIEMNYSPENNFYVDYGIDYEREERITMAPYISQNEESTCCLVSYMDESILLLLDVKRFINDIASAFRKAEFYKPDFDKNTALVICVLRDQNAEKTTLYQRLIEDDPYYFKKHVMLFTEQERSDFEISKKNASTPTYLEYIKNYLYNADNFNKYKSDPKNNCLYQFITNLAAKMPFIPLKNTSVKQFPVISDMFNDFKEIENVLAIENCIELLLSYEMDLNYHDNAVIIAEELVNLYSNYERGLN